MNIKEYKRKKSNRTVTRKRQRSAQINSPNGDISESERNNSNQNRKKKRKIRIDKIIGYITIITIIIFAVIIYSDIKGTDKTVNAKEVLDVNHNDMKTTVTAATNGSKAQVTKANNHKIVCIDPGHGGTDGGAQYSGYSEKDQSLDIAKLVQKNLEAQGITVIMTRTSDVTMSLEKRMEIAKTANAGIFISIHRNYFDTNTSVSGVEAWIHSSSPTDAKSLANNILTQVSKINGINNRGIKAGTMTNEKTNYYLNSDSPCTSCIIELGFITNKADNVLVTTNKNQCSKSIAQGIINYINELEK